METEVKKSIQSCGEMERRIKELEWGTTLQRQAEASLRANEELYSALLGAIPDPVVVYDAQGRATYVNEAFEQVYRWSRAELLGRRLDFFVPQEEKEATQKAWEHTFKGGTVFFETKRQTKEGRLLNIQLRTALLYDSEGEHTASIVIHRDVTELKKAESDLRESETRYRALIGAIPDPVVVYDAGGNAVYINDAFERTYGWSREELIGWHIDFVPPHEKESTREAWEETFQGKNICFETERFTKDGRLLNIQLRTAILNDKEGKLSASIVIHRDVTEARRAKEALEAAHQELEKRVEQRTLELSEVNERLRREIKEKIQAEESLSQSKKRLDLAMEATSDALWDWDLMTNSTYFNRCFYTMLGYEPYELQQSFDTWRSLIHPDDVEHAAHTLNQYVKKKLVPSRWNTA